MSLISSDTSYHIACYSNDVTELDHFYRPSFTKENYMAAFGFHHVIKLVLLNKRQDSRRQIEKLRTFLH